MFACRLKPDPGCPESRHPEGSAIHSLGQQNTEHQKSIVSGPE